MGIRILALLLLSAVAAHAQGAPDPSGHWEGGIDTPEGSIGVVVDLAKNGDGQIAGTIGVPPQNLRGFPLVIESADGRALTFRFRGAPGNRVFQGVLADDGASMSGDFFQSGYSMRFALSRTGVAQIDPPIKSAPIAKELEGEWKGGYELFGYPRKVTIKLQNRGAEGATAEFVILGRKENKLPVDLVTQDGVLITIDSHDTGLSFEGRTGKDEIKGTVIQGPLEIPVVLHREK